jgi:DNA-binding transcriptional LysR family regulator
LSRARLRHLHVFVKVSELLTVKRAAEAVGITQPSATQSLSDLEQLLECSLFLRHAHGMTLTPAGSLLLPLARRVLGLIDDAATQAAALVQGSNEVVRVAAIPAATSSHLGNAIPDFIRAYPGVLVHLQEADAGRQASLVADGDVDCTFCRAPPVLPTGWSFTSLWADRFTIVASPSHPLIKKHQITMEDLAAAIWIVTPSAIAARDAFDAFFAQTASPVRTYGVVTSSATMMWRLLIQEPLLAFVPASVAQSELDAGLLAELTWAQHFPFGDIGILAPQQDHSPALSRFWIHMQKYTKTTNTAIKGES